MPTRSRCAILLFVGTVLALLGTYRPSFVLPKEAGSVGSASPNGAYQTVRFDASYPGADSLQIVLVAVAAACSVGLSAKLSVTGRARSLLKTRRRFVDDGDGLCHHDSMWIWNNSFSAAGSAPSTIMDPVEPASEQPRSSAGTRDCSEKEEEVTAANQVQWPKLNAELANGRVALLATGAHRRMHVVSVPSSSGNHGFGFGHSSSASSSTLPRQSCVSRFAASTGAEVATNPDAAEEFPPVEVALGEDGLPLDVEFDEELVAPVWDPADQVGVTAPLGFFDPVGFTKKGDEGREEFFKFRCAEIKHGRVAMMASIGLLAQHFIRFPGLERVRPGLKPTLEATFSYPGVFYFSAIFLILMYLELAPWSQVDDKEPGNFGDPLNIGMYDKVMRNRELNNGRFAMICVMAILAAQAVTGKDAVQQLGL
eukprot:CAMPEP_0172655694 /NCGR_PEP_ID=MMETSP1074-20121228/851_1 /TAXON_ID=2916 /ORGANISM="Ceratium fusus, Strain PA161109" /LENGTH=424 /DNA_ID=CAMNT_0013470391 /DNA_START=33 /DNA_END=1307 /DNA_ORIENTATION=+